MLYQTALLFKEVIYMLHLFGLDKIDFFTHSDCLKGVQERGCSMCRSQESTYRPPLAAENRSVFQETFIDELFKKNNYLVTIILYSFQSGK